jgi:hypothetical protein
MNVEQARRELADTLFEAIKKYVKDETEQKILNALANTHAYQSYMVGCEDTVRRFEAMKFDAVK